MSHHRQQLPGWGMNSKARLRAWRLGPPGNHVLGPGFHYPLYPWKPRNVDEVWKQDFDIQPSANEKLIIETLDNWWFMSPETETKNPGGTFEDLIPDDMEAGVAGGRGGRYRVKVKFTLPSSVKNAKAVWADKRIQDLAIRPLEINTMKSHR
jgi:hypothetical protein